MSAIQQMIVATSGGASPPTVVFNHISLSTANEGDTVYFYYDYSNFNGETVYWSIAYDAATSDSANFTSSVDGASQLYGSNFNILQIHPKANHVTSGNWHYYVNLGSTYYGSEYGSFGPYTVNDTSTTPNTSLVFDIDPANIPNTTMGFGGVPFNCPDTGGLGINGKGYYATTSADAGGSLVLNGNGEWVILPDLTHSNYQRISISAWIKPSSVSGGETILAKELVYKLRINSGGQLSWAVSSNGGSWTETLLSSTGAVSVDQWFHVVATIDVSHLSLYVNGTLVQQTTGLNLGRNSNPFVIGAYATQYGLSDYFAGSMGEVKFWNYAITDSDVTNEFNNTRTRYILPQATSFDLVAPPSDGRGNPWTDSSSGITATVLNQVGNWGTTSTYGGGIVWDGNNNGYVTLNCYDTTTSFTLSLAVDIEAEAGHWNSIFGDYNSVSPFAYANSDTLTAGVGSSTPVYVSSGATGLAWWDFVYNGTTLKVYKNGSQVGSTGVVSFATSLGNHLQIGQRNGQPGDYLVGTLYRIKYQNTALDQTAITTQYNAVKSTYGLS